MTWNISKGTAYGGVLLTRGGQVLLREPSNQFGGYVWTFAKGTPEPGDSPEMTALREVREETGYEVESWMSCRGYLRALEHQCLFRHEAYRTARQI